MSLTPSPPDLLAELKAAYPRWSAQQQFRWKGGQRRRAREARQEAHDATAGYFPTPGVVNLQAVEAAYLRGYRVQEDGRFTSPSGKVLPYRTARFFRNPANPSEGTHCVRATSLAAYCFFGPKAVDKMARQGFRLAFRDGDRTNLTRANVFLTPMNSHRRRLSDEEATQLRLLMRSGRYTTHDLIQRWNRVHPDRLLTERILRDLISGATYSDHTDDAASLVPREG
jgi:hypothetical protein